MEIIEKVRETVRKYSMLSRGDRVLVGLSGGPDSVCLLTVLNELGQEHELHIEAAYIDHGLRPEETPSEIDFCREVCASMGIPFTATAVDVKSFAAQAKMNKQEAARELRYAVLNKIAAGTGAGRIALGHNADDQAETVLMRLFRGSGPAGLSGIPPVRGIIIRPLINVKRSEIETFFLDASRITHHASRSFMVDSSNLKNEYLRNKIRLMMLPEIKKSNRDVINTIARTADILRDEERYFDIQVTKTLMKLFSRKTGRTAELFLLPMETMDTVILRRVLRRAVEETEGLRGITFTHIEDIAALVKKGDAGDRVYLPKGIRAIKGYSTLVITSEPPVKLGTYVIDGPGQVVLKELTMVIHCEIAGRAASDKRAGSEDRRVGEIDAAKAGFPLTIRSRKPGDFFYPAGFGRRKKLQDYFVDEKIPRDERDSIPLLTSGSDIIWVAGHRLDERYRADIKAEKVMRFELKSLKL